MTDESSLSPDRQSLRDRNNDQEIESLADASLDRQVPLVLQSIEKRYGRGAKTEDRLPYHSAAHTEDVMRRAGTILSVIDGALRAAGKPALERRTFRLTKAAALYHDVILTSRTEQRAEGGNTRVRDPDNEKNSANHLEAFMLDENTKSGKELFTKQDREEGRSAIMATVPQIEADKGGVVQPHLRKGVPSLAAVALALADLGGAGMDGPKQNKIESDRLFFELNPDMMLALTSKPLMYLSSSFHTPYKERILAWSENQLMFAKHRKEAFLEELQLVPEEARAAVQALFGQFDATIEFMERSLEEQRDMGLQPIVVSMLPAVENIR